MLWIILAAAAAPLQTARNAMQRGLLGDAGPWGATLVRFLFGLPFSILIAAVAIVLTRDVHPQFDLRFAGSLSLGAMAQIGATAALLAAMHRSGFAVASVLQQSSLVFAALFGWAMGDVLSPQTWLGVILTTAGVFVLSWPKSGATLRGAAAGTVLGLLSGATFGVSLNAYRDATISLEPHHPLWAASIGVCLAQTLQTVVMVTALAVRRPAALTAVARSWRTSLWAGLCGAAASLCWFGALALAPAAPVRAVGVIETTFAAAVGKRLFKEKLSLREIVGGAMATVGVALAALG